MPNALCCRPVGIDIGREFDASDLHLVWPAKTASDTRPGPSRASARSRGEEACTSPVDPATHGLPSPWRAAVGLRDSLTAPATPRPPRHDDSRVLTCWITKRTTVGYTGGDWATTRATGAGQG